MSKRAASHQLNKDEFEAGAATTDTDDTAVNSGEFQTASKEELATRTFVKAKRSGDTPAKSANAMPAFSFGDAGAKKEEKKTDAKESAAAKPNAFAALMVAGNWECPICLLSNKKENKKCASCEEINPNLSEEEKKKLKKESGLGGGVSAAGVTFGSAVGSEAVSSGTTTFSFGSAATDTTFSFGADTGASKFTFGSDSGSSAGLSFGSVASNSGGWPASDKSVEKEASFKFDASAAVAFGTQGGDGTKDAFKNKQKEASGEEKETVVIKLMAKVYKLTTLDKNGTEKEEKDATFVEAGKGELHLNKYSEGKSFKARLVLRAERTQRLVLNAPLYKDMTYELQSDKYIRFMSSDLDGKMAVFLLKFKAKTDAAEVNTHLKELLSELQ